MLQTLPKLKLEQFRIRNYVVALLFPYMCHVLKKGNKDI